MNFQLKILEIANEFKDDSELNSLIECYSILNNMLINNKYDESLVSSIYNKYKSDILYVSNIRKNTQFRLGGSYLEYNKDEILINNDTDRKRNLVECLRDIIINIIVLKIARKCYFNNLDNYIENIASNDMKLVYETLKLISK